VSLAVSEHMHAEPVLIADALSRAVEVLAGGGVLSPRVDAELLLGHVLGMSRGQVQAKAFMDATIDAAQDGVFSAGVQRRAAREPLQHITGLAPFRSMELSIGPGAFVPRPETEQVAQYAIDALRAAAVPEPRGVDLGAGSGAIALAMATEVPHARIWGVENSPEAFVWAQRNQRETGADNARMVFIDLAHALPELDGTVDVVISNPPYIPTGAIPRDPEVRLFDPEHALYGGEDGLDVVHAVSATALRLLHPGGTLVMEHGELQAAAIAALLRADGWNAVAGRQPPCAEHRWIAPREGCFAGRYRAPVSRVIATPREAAKSSIASDISSGVVNRCPVIPTLRAPATFSSRSSAKNASSAATPYRARTLIKTAGSGLRAP
jgi:release factor glutamine methyltransferase